MDEEQLEQLKAFGFVKPQNKTRYTFSEALITLDTALKRCVGAYDASIKMADDLMAQYVLDGSLKAFEDFTEAFKDIVTMYYAITDKKVLTSLLECIQTFKRENCCDEIGKQMLTFLYERNRLVHQYYNREFMLYQYKETMENYSDGLSDICKNLYEKVKSKELLDTEITK
ncbi:MAG: hypothetical protein IJF03_08570 [Lachnospiraceae bacterium]|nr:hypothetical protein [Lachnospiraceae bacterium]